MMAFEKLFDTSKKDDNVHHLPNLWARWTQQAGRLLNCQRLYAMMQLHAAGRPQTPHLVLALVQDAAWGLLLGLGRRSRLRMAGLLEHTPSALGASAAGAAVGPGGRHSLCM